MSLGWAHLVFKIFIEGNGSFIDVWLGVKKYIFKGLGVSILSGFVIALAFFNIRFYFILGSAHRFTDFLLMGFSCWILFFWLLGSVYHWPILFFQDPPFLKIFYKSFLLGVGNSAASIGLLAIFFVFVTLFSIFWPLWFLIGCVFLFSFHCVTLENQLLRYKITYENRPMGQFLEILDREQQRGVHELLKPWENQ